MASETRVVRVSRQGREWSALAACVVFRGDSNRPLGGDAPNSGWVTVIVHMRLESAHLAGNLVEPERIVSSYRILPDH